jgi:MFS family permease
MGDPAKSSSPTNVRFGVLGFLCTLSMITYLDRICIMRVRGEMKTDLLFTDEQMGYVFAAFYLGYMLFEVPGGWMGDAWGSRKVLTRIVLMWSLFTALTGFIWPFSPYPIIVVATMMIIRFLFGAGEAGAYPNIARITGTWFPYRERGFTQGLVWTCARLGGAIAPLTIGRLTTVLGWRQAFMVLGSVGAFWAVGFYYWFRNSPEEMPSCNEAERELIRQGGIRGRGHLAPPWGVLLRMPSLYALCVASGMVSFGWYFYATWQSLFFEEVFKIDPTQQSSEITQGLPFLSGAAGAFLGGFFSDILVERTGSRRWGRSLMGIVGFSAAGVCFLMSARAGTARQATALLCMASFFNDLAIPPIWAVCTDIGGRYAGTLSGIMNMAGGVGAVACPIFIPTLNAALMDYPPGQRWIVIFTVLASAWFIGAVAWIFIDASKPIETAEEH